MKVIGLTGGIGTGKSTVASFLGELGAACQDLDRTGHEVIKKGSPAYGKLLDTFGDAILGEDGEVRRAELGRLVFNNPEALKKLNGIIHPAIDAVVEERMSDFKRDGFRVAVLEAAAMLESGHSWQVNEIWITTAPEQVVLERLKKRSGYSREESLSRIRSQMNAEERRKYADVVIDTDCTFTELHDLVEREWNRLLDRIQRESAGLQKSTDSHD